MWFATDKGLCKFDGEKIESFTKKTGLPLDRIMDLFIDKNGTVWFSIEPGNVFSNDIAGPLLKDLTKRGNGWGRYNGKNLVAFMNKKSSEYFWSQIANVNGEIWIGGISDENNKGVFLINYNGQELSPTKQLGGKSFPAVNFFVSQGNDNIWVASRPEKNGDFIHHFDGKNLVSYGKKDGLPANNRYKAINKIVKDSKGNLWFGASIGMNNGGLIMFDGNNWIACTEENGVIGKCINQIVEDKDKNVWVSTNKGVNVFDGSSWKLFSEKDKIIGKFITGIFADSKGRVWIGSDKGIALYNEGKWSTVDKNNGLTHNLVRIISEDSKGNIWVGAAGFGKNGGVSVFDGSNWNPLELPKLFTTKFFEDSKGNMWISSIGNGVIKIEGGF
jgi:ligand-binding sensor domain-containing protein